MPGAKEIADDLVAMWRRGEFSESGEKYWAADVVSSEPMEGPMARIQGIDAVRGKGEWWEGAHEVHGVEVEGPYVNGDQFIVRFKMDLTIKESGQRISMDEMALYTLRDGKIAEETFYYGG